MRKQIKTRTSILFFQSPYSWGLIPFPFTFYMCLIRKPTEVLLLSLASNIPDSSKITWPLPPTSFLFISCYWVYDRFYNRARTMKGIPRKVKPVAHVTGLGKPSFKSRPLCLRGPTSSQVTRLSRRQSKKWQWLRTLPTAAPRTQCPLRCIRFGTVENAVSLPHGWAMYQQRSGLSSCWEDRAYDLRKRPFYLVKPKQRAETWWEGSGKQTATCSRSLQRLLI